LEQLEITHIKKKRPKAQYIRKKGDKNCIGKMDTFGKPKIVRVGDYLLGLSGFPKRATFFFVLKWISIQQNTVWIQAEFLIDIWQITCFFTSLTTNYIHCSHSNEYSKTAHQCSTSYILQTPLRHSKAEKTLIPQFIPTI